MNYKIITLEVPGTLGILYHSRTFSRCFMRTYAALTQLYRIMVLNNFAKSFSGFSSYIALDNSVTIIYVSRKKKNLHFLYTTI